MRCELTTSLVSVVDGVTSKVTSASAYPLAAVYLDTPLCFDVTAVNQTGRRTLYESLWVSYNVYTVSKNGCAAYTRDVDAGTRVKPMLNSRATFCFTVGAPHGCSFGVYFAVQRFGSNSWTSTVSDCKVGTFVMSLQRQPARLVLKSVEGADGIVDGVMSQTPHTWLHRTLPSPSAEISLALEFSVLDHYGSTIPPSQFASDFSEAFVAPASCSWEHVKPDTTMGCARNHDDDVVPGRVLVVPYWPIQEGGLVTVSPSFIAPSVTNTSKGSAVRYVIAVSRWCVKCTVSFILHRNAIDTGGYYDPVAGYVRHQVDLSILLPATGTKKHIVFRRLMSPVAPRAHTSSATYYISSAWPLNVNTTDGTVALPRSTPSVILLVKLFL
eukprot:PhM_4_TR2410/c1_g1_i1/m.27693